MPSPPHYPQYYMPQGHPLPPHQYPPGGPSPYPQPMQIDPALSVYPPAPPHHQYTNYVPPPLQLPPDNHNHNHNKNTPSTPSSEASSSMSPSTSKQPSADPNSNGKRPAPPTSGGGSKKKLKKENPAEPESSRVEIAEPIKIKSTRGSRACTVCRRLKMKCVGAEQGPPCKRCAAGGHECIFEESNRGKRSSKKHEMLTKSLRKMEKTLDTVLRSISNPGITSLASGMVSRSPSPSGDEGPSGQTAATHALIEQSSAASPAAESSSHHGSWSGYGADSRRNPDTFRPSKFPAPPLSGFSAASMHQSTSGAFGGPVRSSSPKLHSLPDNNLNPLGLLAEASLANSRNQQASRSAQASASSASSAAKSRGGAPVEPPPETKVGVANDGYFKPGPINFLPLRRLYIERQVQPEMLSFVSTDEVVDLFKIFFDRMTPHCALLERDWHTPSLVCSRSPFLLTTICSIASKFYDKKPELHPKLTTLARKLAFSVPEKGYKSVEIVQAYLLLSLWGCGPVERYEQDKTWMLLGMGIRMATDLNLHRKSNNNGQDTEEGKARDKEVHNRERTWMLCFVLDRSFSAQMGKPHSIKEDFIIRSATQWWRLPQAIPSDVGICAYVELQRILSRSLDFLYSGTQSASGLQMDCDYLLVIKTIEAQLIAWEADWSSAERSLGVTEYRVHVGKFYYYYAMLVVNSFGLQNALERSPVDIGHFFGRCHSSATACALVVRDELAPRGYLRYSPDSHFVLTSYAVLTLLKLIRPEFQAFMDNEAKTIALVKDLADTLEGVAAGPLHTPALYSTFLRALISAKLDGPPSGSRPASPRPRSRGDEAVAGNGPNDPAPAPFDPFATTAGAGSNGPAMMFDYAGLNGEMGPGLDGTAFMQSSGAGDIMSMDSILSQNFWDSVLIPGYSSHFEGLSGGFVYGVGGSGFITPRMGTPYGSGTNTPSKGAGGPQEITGSNLARAFETAGIESTAPAVPTEV